jgi:hypothetical protein
VIFEYFTQSPRANMQRIASGEIAKYLQLPLRASGLSLKTAYAWVTRNAAGVHCDYKAPLDIHQPHGCWQRGGALTADKVTYAAADAFATVHIFSQWQAQRLPLDACLTARERTPAMAQPNSPAYSDSGDDDTAVAPTAAPPSPPPSPPQTAVPSAFDSGPWRGASDALRALRRCSQRSSNATPCPEQATVAALRDVLQDVRSQRTSLQAERRVRLLAARVGVTQIKRTTVRAIRAVGERALGWGATDKQAWQKHHAKERSFKLWKHRLMPSLQAWRDEEASGAAVQQVAAPRVPVRLLTAPAPAPVQVEVLTPASATAVALYGPLSRVNSAAAPSPPPSPPGQAGVTLATLVHDNQRLLRDLDEVWCRFMHALAEAERLERVANACAAAAARSGIAPELISEAVLDRTLCALCAPHPDVVPLAYSASATDATPRPSVEAHRVAAARQRARPWRHGTIGGVTTQHVMALEHNVLYLEDVADVAAGIADAHLADRQRFQRLVGAQLQARHAERLRSQADIDALRRQLADTHVASPPSAAASPPPSPPATPQPRRQRISRVVAAGRSMRAVLFAMCMAAADATRLFTPLEQGTAKTCSMAVAGDGASPDRNVRPRYTPPFASPSAGASLAQLARAAESTLTPPPRVVWSPAPSPPPAPPLTPVRSPPPLRGLQAACLSTAGGGGFRVTPLPVASPPPPAAAAASTSFRFGDWGVSYRDTLRVHTAALPPQSETVAQRARAATAGRLAANWSDALQRVDGPMALRPDDPGALDALLERAGELMAGAHADETVRVDQSHIKAWKKVCALLHTPWLRNDVAANSGADPDGHVNEQVLQALALVAMYSNMQPRSHSDPAPDPQSAMQKLRGVHRVHDREGYTMAPPRLAGKLLKGLMRDYVLTHDVRDVARKLPLTNQVINAMLFDTPDGATWHGRTCRRGSYEWAAATCMWSVMAEGGERKAEVAKKDARTPFQKGRLTFASVVWRIGTKEVADPTLHDLDMLDVLGGGFYLKHGVAKNDFFGIFFAPTPNFHAYNATSVRNAARAMRDLERLAQVRGAARATTPLFGPTCGTEFTHHEAETMFELALIFGARVAQSDLDKYSLHSFRIWVACALLAQQVSRNNIKRHLRWRGDESLEVYARLNDSEWASHIALTYTANVDSTISARLQGLGAIDVERMAAAVARMAG